VFDNFKFQDGSASPDRLSTEVEESLFVSLPDWSRTGEELEPPSIDTLMKPEAFSPDVMLEDAWPLRTVLLEDGNETPSLVGLYKVFFWKLFNPRY
jgi:hypothetical protein